jgi:hypothetical protein
MQRVVYADPVPDALLCGLCKQALHEATWCGCSHNFCRSCVTPLPQRCPVGGCGKRFSNSEVSPNAQAEKQLQGLTVHCPHRPAGCFWTRPRDKLDAHLDKTCKFNSRQCKWGCGFEASGTALRTHEGSCSKADSPRMVATALGSSRNQISQMGESPRTMVAPTAPGSSRNQIPQMERRASADLSSSRGGGLQLSGGREPPASASPIGSRTSASGLRPSGDAGLQLGPARGGSNNLARGGSKTGGFPKSPSPSEPPTSSVADADISMMVSIVADLEQLVAERTAAWVKERALLLKEVQGSKAQVAALESALNEALAAVARAPKEQDVQELNRRLTRTERDLQQALEQKEQAKAALEKEKRSSGLEKQRADDVSPAQAARREAETLLKAARQEAAQLREDLERVRKESADAVRQQARDVKELSAAQDARREAETLLKAAREEVERVRKESADAVRQQARDSKELSAAQDARREAETLLKAAREEVERVRKESAHAVRQQARDSKEVSASQQRQEAAQVRGAERRDADSKKLLEPSSAALGRSHSQSKALDEFEARQEVRRRSASRVEETPLEVSGRRRADSVDKSAVRDVDGGAKEEREAIAAKAVESALAEKDDPTLVERNVVAQRLGQFREASHRPNNNAHPLSCLSHHAVVLLLLVAVQIAGTGNGKSATIATEPDLPAKRGAKKEKSAGALPLPLTGPEMSDGCLRVVLLMVTEKLKGDGDLKSDMPLTTVPQPRLVLLVRSGVLLGKAIARFSPGAFDPLCLRTKGGEASWNLNIDQIWGACPSFGKELRDALSGGSVQAAWQMLRLVVLAGLEPRARSVCKQWLGPNAETWPLPPVLYSWVWRLNERPKMYEEVAGAADVAVPDAEHIGAALVLSGVLHRDVPAGKAQTGLAELLQGTALDGAITGPTVSDAGQLEMMLLWAVTSAIQKSKARGSVIRSLGSDTSWIAKSDRASKK